MTFWLCEMARVSDGESPSGPAGFAGRAARWEIGAFA
jgi:hypothetical protein